MTFSHKSVIDLVKTRFVAVWESAAPVRTATFDLGDGKQVTGTTGGEMAIFFCAPDGRVFDILPALHSPKVVYETAVEALKLYERLKASGRFDEEVARHHAAEFAKSPPIAEPGHRKTLRERWQTGDGATRDLSRMMASKSGFVTPTESIVVVEPGGLAFYRRQVHELLSRPGARRPAEIRTYVFETILAEKLEDRGKVVYSFDAPQPFSIHESPGDFDIEEEHR